MSRTLARLERILTMVPWLLDNPGVTLDEVGERFEVSRSELLTDLDVLGYCGLPGYGGGDLIECSVVGDAVTVRMAHFFERPLRLSLREALTLLLAARAFAGVEGLADSAPLDRAATKLEQALGAVAGDVVRVAFELDLPGSEHLGALRAALDRQLVVGLVYRSESRGQTTEREVEPWALTAVGGAWYLQGWCRMVDGPRDFRLDRIRDLRVTDETAPPPRREPLPPVYQPGPDDVTVVLDLERPAWWVAEWAVTDAVKELRSVRQVTLRTRELDWAARLVLRLAGSARVVAPSELVARVAELAQQTLDRYQRADPSL